MRWSDLMRRQDLPASFSPTRSSKAVARSPSREARVRSIRNGHGSSTHRARGSRAFSRLTGGDGGKRGSAAGAASPSVGVLPTAARLYFPTLSGESSRQTTALLLATLPYPRLVSGQRIVFLTDWRAFMRSRRTTARRVLLVTSALAVIGCTETIGPRLGGLGGPSFALDQWNGTFGQSGRLLIKGFNPTNPHVGDAIIATFYWVGSTNIIDSVTDVLTTAPYTPVGNRYTLVEYVTAGGISMATYVATNVQGFPDGYNAPGGDSILAVRANLRDSVVASGISIASFTGVTSVAVQALGAHRSASGTGSTQTIADPGAISVNAGAHVYTATLSNALVGPGPPAGFTSFVQSDNTFKGGSAFAVQANAGTVDPQWSWFFNSPSTWLATVLALNPAPPPQPIALDQLNGTFGESGRFLAQGFNPTNPHVGDAIVATFSWVGSTNIIDSVTDHLNLVGLPRVGNTYKLIE